MTLKFIESAALLIALCWLHALNMRHVQRPLLRRLLAGGLFGAICVVGMLAPFTLPEGLIFDARSVVLSMAGLFGGPLVAGIAGLMAGAYRLWLGGVGVMPGRFNILMPVLLGLAYRGGLPAQLAAHRRLATAAVRGAGAPVAGAEPEPVARQGFQPGVAAGSRADFSGIDAGHPAAGAAVAGYLPAGQRSPGPARERGPSRSRYCARKSASKVSMSWARRIFDRPPREEEAIHQAVDPLQGVMLGLVGQVSVAGGGEN